MNDDTIIPVTATIEALLAECVGEAPELVQMKDWRTMALRLSRRLEESGLRIIRHATTIEDRGRLMGPIRPGEIMMVLADGPFQACLVSSGVAMSAFSIARQHQIWTELLPQAIADLATARLRKSGGAS
jgi:hypothetical protein